jgi:two-component system chemotaxis sensor kinase CheA
MSMTSEAEAYPLAQFRKTYFEECAELLDALQSNLEVLSSGSEDGEILHAIFRSVHSIKGGAGAFGCTDLVAFSHTFESLLDSMREQKVATTHDVVHVLLRASDALTDIVNAARLEQPLPAEFGADIRSAMQDALQSAGGAPAPAANAVVPSELPGEHTYRIAFRPHSEMLKKANEPLLLIRQLRKLGGLTLEVDSSRLPTLAALEPEAAYLSWTFTLETGAPKSAIHEVFEFVEDDCEIKIDVIDVPAAPVEASGSEMPGAAVQAVPPPSRSGSTSTRSTGWSIWSASS